MDKLPVEILDLVLGNLDNNELANSRLCCHKLDDVATPLIRQCMYIGWEKQHEHRGVLDMNTKVMTGGCLDDILGLSIGSFVLQSLAKLVINLDGTVSGSNVRQMLQYILLHVDHRIQTIELVNIQLTKEEDVELCHWVCEQFHSIIIKLNISNRTRQPTQPPTQHSQQPLLRIFGGIRELTITNESRSDFTVFRSIKAQDGNVLQRLKMCGDCASEPEENQHQDIETGLLQPLKDFVADCNHLSYLDIQRYFFADLVDFEWLPSSLETLKMFSVPTEFVQQTTNTTTTISNLKHLQLNSHCFIIECIRFPDLESIRFTNVEFDRPTTPDIDYLFQNSPKLRHFSGYYNHESEILTMLNALPEHNVIEHVELALWPDFALSTQWPCLMHKFRHMKRLFIRHGEFSVAYYTRSDLVVFINRVLTVLHEHSMLDRRDFCLEFDLNPDSIQEDEEGDDGLLDVITVSGCSGSLFQVDIAKFRTKFCSVE